MKKMIAVLCAVAAMSFLAACGGGGSDSSKESSSASSSKENSSATTSGSSGGSNANWCDDVDKASNEISAKMDATGSGQQNPDEIIKDFRSISSKLPSEIRGDWNKFVDAFADYIKAVGSLDASNMTDPAVIERLEKAAQQFDTPENQALMTKLDNYFGAKCPGYTAN